MNGGEQIAPGMQESITVGTDALTFCVTTEAVLAIVVYMPPGGGPPFLHRHAADEIYRVERGEFAIYIEDDGGTVRRRRASAGSTVHMPGGYAHTVRNESDAPARAYVVFAPGTGLEGFFRAAAAAAPADVPALAAAHGIEPAAKL